MEFIDIETLRGIDKNIEFINLDRKTKEILNGICSIFFNINIMGDIAYNVQNT